MKLREYMDDRSKRARLAIACALVPFVGAILYAYVSLMPAPTTTMERSTARIALYITVGVCFAVVIAFGGRLMRRTACPKCGEPLGELASAHFSASLAGKPDYTELELLKGCPTCGLGLDEELPN
jgi:polyferredoxin